MGIEEFRLVRPNFIRLDSRTDEVDFGLAGCFLRARLAAFVNLTITRFNLDVLLEPIAHGLWFKKRQ